MIEPAKHVVVPGGLSDGDPDAIDLARALDIFLSWKTERPDHTILDALDSWHNRGEEVDFPNCNRRLCGALGGNIWDWLPGKSREEQVVVLVRAIELNWPWPDVPGLRGSKP